MRRRRKFLPILVIALVAQILAPIAACWAASAAAGDPLQSIEICHTKALSGVGQGNEVGDQTGDHQKTDSACSLCCVAQATASLDAPQTALTRIHRNWERVAWCDKAPRVSGCRSGSNAQARAPPSLT
jgi:hypothetical protein